MPPDNGEVEAWFMRWEFQKTRREDKEGYLTVGSDDLATNATLWPNLARRIGLEAAPLREIRNMPERTAPENTIEKSQEAGALYAELTSLAHAKLAS